MHKLDAKVRREPSRKGKIPGRGNRLVSADHEEFNADERGSEGMSTDGFMTRTAAPVGPLANDYASQFGDPVSNHALRSA
jgi:hypothetical protein